MKNHEITEQVMRSLVKSVGLKAFAIGLHNTFFHGEVLQDVDDVKNLNEQLPKLYEGIDQFNRAAGNKVWRDK